MSPDEVMQKPRFVRTFLLKSMEVQLEEEIERAKALERKREQQTQQARAARGRRR